MQKRNDDAVKTRYRELHKVVQRRVNVPSSKALRFFPRKSNEISKGVQFRGKDSRLTHSTTSSTSLL